MSRDSGDLDPIIHTTSRLRIMTTLSTIGPKDSLSFEKLRALLDMTAGNLSVHLTKLEDAGYISIEKTFEGRKPATYVAMTTKGRAAFEQYLANLKALLGGISPA
jgi:DNA-binding MarR family transcriptional regulator